MTGNELKAKRKELQLTQEQLGEALGVTRKTVLRWETETTPIPTKMVAKINQVEPVDWISDDDYQMLLGVLIEDEVQRRVARASGKPRPPEQTRQRQDLLNQLTLGQRQRLLALFQGAAIEPLRDDLFGRRELAAGGGGMPPDALPAKVDAVLEWKK